MPENSVEQMPSDQLQQLSSTVFKQPGSRSAKYVAAWAMLSFVQQCRILGSAGTCAGTLTGTPEGAEGIAGVASKTVSVELVASSVTCSCCAVLRSLRPLRTGLTAVVFRFLAAGWAGACCIVFVGSDTSLRLCVV